MITQNYLKQVLHYNPDSGDFTWQNPSKFHSQLKNKKAGCLDKSRITIVIDRVHYFAHRLAWLYMYGTMPKKSQDIDHINMDPSDNRIANLRLATRSDNLCNKDRNSNNRSGLKGVGFHKASGKWRARCFKGNVRKEIYGFDTKEEAYAAYLKIADEIHGLFFFMR